MSCNNSVQSWAAHSSVHCLVCLFWVKDISCVILYHLHKLAFLCLFHYSSIKIKLIWTTEWKLNNIALTSSQCNYWWWWWWWWETGWLWWYTHGEAEWFTALMEVLTGTMCSYLEWCSLCLAGINCSLIRCHWDLWEEELFSWCQVLSYCSVSAWEQWPCCSCLKRNPHRKHPPCLANTILDFFSPYICISCSFLNSPQPAFTSPTFSCFYMNLGNNELQYEQAE